MPVTSKPPVQPALAPELEQHPSETGLYAPPHGAYINDLFHQGGQPIAKATLEKMGPASRKALERAALRDPSTAYQVFAKTKTAVPKSEPEADEDTETASDDDTIVASRPNLNVDANREDIPRFNPPKPKKFDTSVSKRVPDELRNRNTFAAQPPEVKRQLLGPAGEHLRDDELRTLNVGSLDTLHNLYQDLKATAPSLEAAAEAGKIKRGWYQHTAKALDELFGREAPRFTALLAATSPRMSVEDNFLKALAVWEWYQQKLQATGHAHNSTTPSFGEVRDWIRKEQASGNWKNIVGDKRILGTHDKATATALSASPDQLHEPQFRGLFDTPKIDSFYRNLRGNLDAVTQDAWMSYLAGKSPDLPGKPQKDFSGYLAMNSITRQVAASLNHNLDTGEKPWTAAEVQECAWSFFRTLAKMSGQSRVTKPGRSFSMNDFGKPISGTEALAVITPEHISSTVDFTTMLATDPAIQNKVKSLGPEFQRRLAAFRRRYTANPPAWERPNDKPVASPGSPALEPLGHRAGRHTSQFAGPVRYAKADIGGLGSSQANVATAEPPAAMPVTSNKAAPVLPRGGKPMDTEQPGPTSGIFHSPNTDENLSFETAYQRTRSANQKVYHQLSNDILKKVGIKRFTTHDAIGDWSDGAENSVAQLIHDGDPDTVNYAAAWFGYLANQKSVLAFHSAEDGPDSVYNVNVPGINGNDLRKQLSQAGIPFRTLVPGPRGFEVIIYDGGRSLRNAVANFAGQHHASVRESTGKGEFIGGDTRSAARREYRKRIYAYENAGGTPGKPASTGTAVRPRYQPSEKHDTAGPTAKRFARTGEVVLNAKHVEIDSYRGDARHREGELVKKKPGKNGTLALVHDRSKEGAKPAEWRAYKVSELDNMHTVKADKPDVTPAKPASKNQPLKANTIARKIAVHKKQPVKYEQYRAPANGIVVRGKFYPGGEMIPTEELRRASPGAAPPPRMKMAASEQPSIPGKVVGFKPAQKGTEEQPYNADAGSQPATSYGSLRNPLPAPTSAHLQPQQPSSDSIHRRANAERQIQAAQPQQAGTYMPFQPGSPNHRWVQEQLNEGRTRAEVASDIRTASHRDRVLATYDQLAQTSQQPSRPSWNANSPILNAIQQIVASGDFGTAEQAANTPTAVTARVERMLGGGRVNPDVVRQHLEQLRDQSASRSSNPRLQLNPFTETRLLLLARNAGTPDIEKYISGLTRKGIETLLYNGAGINSNDHAPIIDLWLRAHPNEEAPTRPSRPSPRQAIESVYAGQRPSATEQITRAGVSTQPQAFRIGSEDYNMVDRTIREEPSVTRKQFQKSLGQSPDTQRYLATWDLIHQTRKLSALTPRPNAWGQYETAKDRERAAAPKEPWAGGKIGAEIPREPVLPKVASFTPEWRTATADEFNEATEHLFGGHLKPEQMGAAVNAVDGANITFRTRKYRDGGMRLQCNTRSEGMYAERTFSKEEDDEIVCHNDLQSLDRSPYKNHGIDLFTNQVAALRKMGVTRIETMAAGRKGGSMNGYYTWIRFGFEAELPESHYRMLPAAMQRKMGRSRSLRKLFDEVPGGNEWWREHGEDVNAYFDLADNSPSMKALAAYLKLRKSPDYKKKYARSQSESTHRRSPGKVLQRAS